MSTTPNPKSAESDTPRTDAEQGLRAVTGVFYKDKRGRDVEAKFAKKLERELATCREAALREAAEVALNQQTGNTFTLHAYIKCEQAILSLIKKDQQ